MLKPLFLSVLLLLAPHVVRAEDPVVFFDGVLPGWKIGISMLGYDCKGRLVFVGHSKENFRKYYAYDIESKKIQRENKCNKNIDYLNENYEYLKMDPIINRYHGTLYQGGFYYNHIFGYEEYLEEDKHDKSWFILLLGKKTVKGGWSTDDEAMDYYDEYKTKFDHIWFLYNDREDNLYIHSILYKFFYKVPKEMRRKIIVRDRLAYFPLRFLVKAWDVNPKCPNRKDISEARAQEQQDCFDAIFRQLPKGDFDADSPYPIPVNK